MNLGENCIPLEVFNMNINNYNEFLELRRRLMAESGIPSVNPTTSTMPLRWAPTAV